MSGSTADLWQAVLGQLELSVSAANFNTWIKTLSLSEDVTDTATIYTPNFMSKNYVEKKFGPAIYEAINKINPSITSVTYEVKKTAKKDRALEDVFDKKPNTQAEPSKKPTPREIVQKPSSGPSQAIYGRSSAMRGTPNVMRRAEGGIAGILEK